MYIREGNIKLNSILNLYRDRYYKCICGYVTTSGELYTTSRCYCFFIVNVRETRI